MASPWAAFEMHPCSQDSLMVRPFPGKPELETLSHILSIRMQVKDHGKRAKHEAISSK